MFRNKRNFHCRRSKRIQRDRVKFRATLRSRRWTGCLSLRASVSYEGNKFTAAIHAILILSMQFSPGTRERDARRCDDIRLCCVAFATRCMVIAIISKVQWHVVLAFCKLKSKWNFPAMLVSTSVQSFLVVMCAYIIFPFGNAKKYTRQDMNEKFLFIIICVVTSIL